MGLFREEEKGPPEKKQRWEFITLSDFKSRSPFTGIAYAWLWLMAFVAIAVYALDTFTAINLLVFDRWSSQVKPKIPFKYSRWIFAVCILISWALCIYEWIRAIRVMKRGGVAASYMDPLAASLQSMRPKGWKRFLVFTSLTRSKKGTDYIAFFVYFAFQGAIRIILAEGPRQVVNALTLYAVMQADLIDGGKTDGDNSHLEQFWDNLKSLYSSNYEQAAIYSSMLFTLVIWVISAICLMTAAVLYIVFLWHYIPQRDGRLRIYCRRKIDRRLEKITQDKTKAAIEEENAKREKAERKAELKRQKTGELPPPQAPKQSLQPTLPQLGDPDFKGEEKPPFPLNRMETTSSVSTLPLYSSRPPTRQGMERQPTLPGLDTHYESDAPLLANAGFAGGDRVMSPAPSYHRQNSNASSFGRRPAPGRSMTQSTQGSYMSASSRPPPGPNGRFPVRSNTATSFGYENTESPSEMSPVSPFDSLGRPMNVPPRVNTADSFRPPPRGPSRQGSDSSYYNQTGVHPPSLPRMASQSSTNSFSRPFSPTAARENQPTPPPGSYEMTAPPRSYTPAAQPPPPSAGGSSYVAFNPQRTSPSPVTSAGPMRSVTLTNAQPGAGGSYFGDVGAAGGLMPPQRSATAPNDMRAISSYGSIIDDYSPEEEPRRMSPMPAPNVRSRTAGPMGGGPPPPRAPYGGYGGAGQYGGQF